MDIMTSIASLSMEMASQKLGNDISTALLSKTLKQAESDGAAAVEMINSVPVPSAGEAGGLLNVLV